MYNGIVLNKQYHEGKRRLINTLKNYYQKNDDVLNTQLMNSYERKWYFQNNSSSFTLALAFLSNDFGLSLIRPLLWILLFVAIQIVIILIFSGCCFNDLVENWGLFFNLINPAHKTSLFVLEECNPSIMYKNVLNITDNINRIIIGFLIFQFASAFRYKYKLR